MNNNDLTLVLTGRVPILVLETHDEPRALDLLSQHVKDQRLAGWQWSVTDGVKPLSLTLQDEDSEVFRKPVDVLDHIKKQSSPALYVLCDFHPFLDDPVHVRYLKEIAHSAAGKRQKIVLLSHQLNIPPELQRLCARASLTMPTDEEIMAIIREEGRDWVRENKQKIKSDNGTLHKLVNNLRGLPHQDVRRLVHSAIADDGVISDEDLPDVARAKFRLMDMDDVLHFDYSAEQLRDVAGLQKLKAWLEHRRAIVLDERASDIDVPKGVLLFGVQGGGKSLAAKAIAGVWGLPLLRLDMAALYNKYIGETEKNLREALKLADLMAPCVLWMDEVEKGMSQGGSDNSTAKRLLGTLLTWMSERRSRVFMVATSNDISQLPPELMRKGRFDEIFFVDLPDEESRKAIFEIHLRKRQFDSKDYDLGLLAERADGFTGAEIEQAIVSAVYSVQALGDSLSTGSILQSLEQTQPLSVVMAENIANLRAWAAERAVPAS